MDGCTPNVNWSLCEDSTGFPRVLPAFYVVSAIFFGGTGMLYLFSMAKTLQTQFREKRRLSYNTAMQMHVGIVAFCVAAVCHDAALVTQEPRMPALPLLLLFHFRLMCIVYVTTVLVRHWAVLYQQMTRNQRNQSKKIERFIVIYRDGEVVEAVLTCSFFFGTVVYGVRNQDSWGNVERLQFLVWAVISGVTCSLVAILGQRVHAGASPLPEPQTLSQPKQPDSRGQA